MEVRKALLVTISRETLLENGGFPTSSGDLWQGTSMRVCTCVHINIHAHKHVYAALFCSIKNAACKLLNLLCDPPKGYLLKFEKCCYRERALMMALSEKFLGAQTVSKSFSLRSHTDPRCRYWCNPHFTGEITCHHHSSSI